MSPGQHKVAAIPVETITLERVEGPAGAAYTVQLNAWHAAEHILRLWAQSAPADGGYDKCQVQVTWRDHAQMEWRCDLTHAMVDYPSSILGVALWRLLSFRAGRWHPQKWTDAQADMIRAQADASRHERSKCALLLDCYELPRVADWADEARF